MWDSILETAISNGLFASLFVALFIYMIKDGSKREKRYQETISDLTTRLSVVKELDENVVKMQQDVGVIKNDVEEVKQNVKVIKTDVECLKKTFKFKQSLSTETTDVTGSKKLK